MIALIKPSISAFFIAIFSITPATRSYAQDPITVIIKQATIKVIKALDLQIQRLQNKTIDFQNIQKQVENTLSKLKLQEIADWTQKHKIIYEEYFDELWRVKSTISYYKRFVDIIKKGKELINEYKRSYSLIRNDNHFTTEEIEYMGSVYRGIIDKTSKTIDQLLLLLQSFSLQMSDAQRLALLNSTTDEIESYISDLRRFTDHNMQLSLQRSKNLNEINQIKRLYGIER